MFQSLWLNWRSEVWTTTQKVRCEVTKRPDAGNNLVMVLVAKQTIQNPADWCLKWNQNSHKILKVHGL